MSKSTYKRNIDRFVAMDEEEQRDFLFLMLDTMDEIVTAIGEAKTNEEKEMRKRDFAFYENVASFFLDDPKWMKETPYSTIGFLRKYARKEREKWGGRKKNKA